jgi:hypothetical protein
MNREALLWTDGKKNMPGLTPIGYFGFTSEAVTIPELPEAPASMSAAGIISSNIVMGEGKFMWPMYGTLTKLSLKGEAQGERDSMTKVRTISWKYPDTDPAAIGLDIMSNNANMFFIVQDQNKRNRLVGNKSIPAQLKASDNSGAGPSDEKGYTFEISDFGIGAAPIYEGTIPLNSSFAAQGLGV